jgi:hypothetical protein
MLELPVRWPGCVLPGWLGCKLSWLAGWQVPDHIERDELREPLVAGDADVARPARGDQQRQGAGEVGGAGPGAAPQEYSLAVGLAGGEQHDGDLAAPGVDPGLRAADPHSVWRDDAPCARDQVPPGRAPRRSLGIGRQMAGHPVPLEYSIEWLTCALASRLDVVLVSLPGAAQDRLPAHVPGTRPGRPSVPGRPGEGC